MTAPTTKPNCRECVHMLTLPGDAHIRCNNHSAKVLGHAVGIRNGWFRWPVSFDPVWLLACDGFSTDERDRRPVQKVHPLLELAGLLK
jgi:hypothetical protein